MIERAQQTPLLLRVLALAVVVMVARGCIATGQEMPHSPLTISTQRLAEYIIVNDDSIIIGVIPARAILDRVLVGIDTALTDVDSVSVTLDNGDWIGRWVPSEGGNVESHIVAIDATAVTGTQARNARTHIYNSGAGTPLGQIKIAISYQTVD